MGRWQHSNHFTTKLRPNSLAVSRPVPSHLWSISWVREMTLSSQAPVLETPVPQPTGPSPLHKLGCPVRLPTNPTWNSCLQMPWIHIHLTHSSVSQLLTPPSFLLRGVLSPLLFCFCLSKLQSSSTTAELCAAIRATLCRPVPTNAGCKSPHFMKNHNPNSLTRPRVWERRGGNPCYTYVLTNL